LDLFRRGFSDRNQGADKRIPPKEQDNTSCLYGRMI